MDPLNGNEGQNTLVDWLAEAIELALEDSDTRGRVDRNYGFQSYCTLRLDNGAEFQITPVRSGWPDDGTSLQWADVDEEAEICQQCGYPEARCDCRDD